MDTESRPADALDLARRCPACGGRLTWDGDRERFECTAPDGAYAYGDALSLLRHVRGWTALEAAERVGQVLRERAA